MKSPLFPRSIKAVVLVVLTSVSWMTSVSGQKFVNEFLNIGVGARAHGMFGSVVANVDDGTAGYWNAAGLTQITSPLQIQAMHTNWFGGISNYDYISISKKLRGEKQAAGSLSIIRLGVDNIPNTLNLIGPDGTVNYDRITTFSTADYAAILSYAQNMDTAGKFALGGSIKVINRSIGEFGSAWGFGADLGAQWRGDKLSFGLSVRDITTTFNTWTFNLQEDEKNVFASTGNDIPVSSTELTLPRMIFGIAYKGKTNSFSYLVEADLNVSTNGTEAGVFSGNNLSVDPTIGFELGFSQKVYLRGGLGNIQSVVNDVSTDGLDRGLEFQPNVGLGLNLGRLNVDYALSNVGGVSGILSSHIFSLSLDFNARKKEEQ